LIRIAGAGLDAFAKEPLPAASPLLGLDNVVLTGHVAYATDVAARAAAQNAIDAVVKVARGEKPAGALNPEVIQRRLVGKSV
jgi:phosphoglycerate dehydrogenase-like enzyme